MMEVAEKVERVPSEPGSHPSGHAASGVDGASRFDPSRKCPRCNGNGWHTVRNPDPLLRGVFEVDCEECHGHG